MWDLWWAKWHWDRLFFEFFGFPLSISFYPGSPLSYIIWRMKNRGCSPSHPIDMNNKKASTRTDTHLYGDCTIKSDLY
jgi:hypothetical protein